MQKLLVLLFILPVVSFSETATQTDWSGGSGYPGPVTDWGNNYDTGYQIDHSADSLLLHWGILAVSERHTVDGSFDGSRATYAVDVDGDDDVDILGAAYNADDITWWENEDGTGTSWTEHPIDGSFNGAASVYAADVNGDGDIDVLGAGYMADEISWWESSDTGSGIYWTKHVVWTGYNSAVSVYATDVDGDGDVDVLGAGHYDDLITWWENTDGSGTAWAWHTVDGNFNGATSVYATDVDGDGDVDVLGAGRSCDEIAWWENNNGIGTSWTWHTVDASFDGAASVYATDMDGDGDTDVFGAAYSADEITWWENSNGAGTSWTKHVVNNDFGGAFSVYPEDLDDDGDLDMLGAAWLDNDIAWWENTDGTGTAWTEHMVYGSFTGAYSAYATDVDGDGRIDVIGAASEVDDIAWWNLIGHSPVGTLESSILDAEIVNCWEDFVSSGNEPAGTSLGFQFRSSNSSANMGAWSDTVFTSSTSLSGILADSTKFLQYRVILETTDPAISPVLNEVTFTYSTNVSIGDNYGSGIINWDLAPGANPSFGNCAVLVSAPQPGIVNLVLHDVTGRVIAQHSQELLAGTHSVSFNNIAQGVYFCTMRAGDFTATERVVVLK